MDNLKKSLAERKKEAEDLQSSLAALYREYGEAQFEYASQRNERVAHISDTSLSAWEALRKSRLNDTDSILNIKTIRSRQNDLKALHKEVDKLTGEIKQNYEKTWNRFLLLFFETYQNTSLPAFDSITQAIGPITDSINKIQEKQQSIEQQKTDAHFLKKLLAAPQLLSLKTQAGHLQKKRNEEIIAAGTEVLTEDMIKEVRGESFPEELEQAYVAYEAIIAKQTELAQRKEMLNAEEESLAKTLAEYGVTDSSSKHITALTDKIRETDTHIEQAESQQGVLYSDVFYTADGKSTGEALTDVPDTLRPYLTSIADCRTKLEKNKRDIEYIENEIAYEAEERKIEALHNSIVRYKEGILQYEKLIQTAEENITQAEGSKQALTERNNELKAKD